ncbi:hypothetical protein PR202_ga16425 [Eleusine coracana subsp. coracana]|uniref:B box-type domain-containing protein n=1 Tax=Eleusine coracana subsp. coracana TaxID=191504 RepID=A0AAV5CME7_ELECO|nr:hypothetical protein PR202_ga16425 [Eleusine coracana subsp. coracana]
MRTICDVCESAPAVLFCAADEAALCRPCDEKVIPAPSFVNPGSAFVDRAERWFDWTGLQRVVLVPDPKFD